MHFRKKCYNDFLRILKTKQKSLDKNKLLWLLLLLSQVIKFQIAKEYDLLLSVYGCRNRR